MTGPDPTLAGDLAPPGVRGEVLVHDRQGDGLKGWGTRRHELMTFF